MRLSREIDVRARLVFFVDYVVAIITISAMPKNQVGSRSSNVSRSASEEGRKSGRRHCLNACNAMHQACDAMQPGV